MVSVHIRLVVILVYYRAHLRMGLGLELRTILIRSQRYALLPMHEWIYLVELEVLDYLIFETLLECYRVEPFLGLLDLNK